MNQLVNTQFKVRFFSFFFSFKIIKLIYLVITTCLLYSKALKAVTLAAVFFFPSLYLWISVSFIFSYSTTETFIQPEFCLSSIQVSLSSLVNATPLIFLLQKILI